MNMFIQLIFLPLLLLFSLPFISAHKYGAYCTSDSGCDQHQKCLNQSCRCSSTERRFWTGTICAICAAGYTATYDRCYKLFTDLKTWTAARNHCHSQYADLFTWRNNDDEQFIQPVIQQWITLPAYLSFWQQFNNTRPPQPYLSWSAATISSLNPFTVNWANTAGMQLTLQSRQWCDPTKDVGYTGPKEPTSGRRQNSTVTENEECVTYNFGKLSKSLLCLADDYCSQRYPFICEMNAVSMALANSLNHGQDNNINFEEQKPPPPSPDPTPENGIGTTDIPSALGDEAGLSKTTVIILIVVAIILIVGAIAGYIIMKKKKEENRGDHTIIDEGGTFQNRPSFDSSVESTME